MYINIEHRLAMTQKLLLRERLNALLNYYDV